MTPQTIPSSNEENSLLTESNKMLVLPSGNYDLCNAGVGQTLKMYQSMNNSSDNNHEKTKSTPPATTQYLSLGLLLITLLTFTATVVYNAGGVGGGTILTRTKSDIVSIVEPPLMTEATSTADPAFSTKSLTKAIPVMVGQELTGGITKNTLLSGYKLATADGENPMKGAALKCVPDNAKYETTIETQQIVTTKEELAEATDIEGSLSISYGPMASGEGAGKFLSNTVSSRNRVIMTYSKRYTFYLTECKSESYGGSLQPSEALQDKLDNSDSGTVFDTFGTKYVDQVIFGSQLSVSYEVTSESELSQSEIEAQLGGSIGVGPLSVDFEAKFDDTKTSEKERYYMKIEVKALGSSIAVKPTSTSVDEVNGYIKSFEDDFEAKKQSIESSGGVANSPFAQQMTAVAFTLGDLSSVVPSLDANKASKLTTRMQDLSIVWQDSLFKKSQLDIEDKRLSDLYPSGQKKEEIYYPWREAKRNEMMSITQKIEECQDYRNLKINKMYKTDVPAPLETRDDRIIDGLVGNAYIEGPLTLGDKQFPGMYWEGYTIEDGVPFLEGDVFCSDNNEKIAPGPQSPSDLAKMLDSTICLRSGACFVGGSSVYWGSPFYLDMSRHCCYRPGEYRTDTSGFGYCLDGCTKTNEICGGKWFGMDFETNACEQCCNRQGSFAFEYIPYPGPLLPGYIEYYRKCY